MSVPAVPPPAVAPRDRCHQETDPGADATTVRTLSPCDHDTWDRYVDRTPDGTLFHTTVWMNAVVAAFGHRPIYLYATRGPRWVGALPLFRVDSLLAGTMLVSVPYAVYGGVVADDQNVANRLLMAAWRVMEREGAGVVDLRSAKAVDPALPINDRYATFRRPLPRAVDDVLGWLPRKARAAARNARTKFGLTVEFDDQQLPIVWHLYCRGMRRLASLSYPYSFFQKLVDLTPGRHMVSVVRHENRPIGGLLTILHNGVAMPYFVGSDAAYHHTGVNNFIYLTAMERAVELGCRVFDFGRTRRDNTGCFNFKRFQGFEPEYLEYQRLVAPGAAPPDLTPSNPRFGLARRVWPYLPLAVTRRLGTHLSRHVPG